MVTRNWGEEGGSKDLKILRIKKGNKKKNQIFEPLEYCVCCIQIFNYHNLSHHILNSCLNSSGNIYWSRQRDEKFLQIIEQDHYITPENTLKLKWRNEMFKIADTQNTQKTRNMEVLLKNL